MPVDLQMSADSTQMQALPTSGNIGSSVVQSHGSNEYATRTIDDITKERNADVKQFASNNVANDMNGGGAAPAGPNMAVGQETINRMIPGIQTASMDGLLKLPSRDIPQTTEPYTNDRAVQRNTQVKFAPDTKDYIPKETFVSAEKRDDSTFDAMYHELLVPVVAGLLFYIFNNGKGLAMLMKLAPAMFRSDGNIKAYGNVIIAVMFSGVFYTLTKTYNVMTL